MINKDDIQYKTTEENDQTKLCLNYAIRDVKFLSKQDTSYNLIEEAKHDLQMNLVVQLHGSTITDHVALRQHLRNLVSPMHAPEVEAILERYAPVQLERFLK